MKLVAGTLSLMLFGWAVVAAADSRHEAADPVVVTRVETRTVEVPAEVVETPIADMLTDWVEVDRQDECLWRFIQERGLELSFEMVWAAGVVTDALGGACYLMETTDE